MGDLGQIAQHRHRVGAIGILRAKLVQRPRRIARHDHLEQVQNPATIREAQHRAHLINGGFSRTMGNRLIHQTHRIADRALCRAGDQRQRVFGNLRILFTRN